MNNHESGLSKTDLETIKKAITSTKGISEVILFGSRAIGTAKTGSDVDLAIRCTQGAVPSEIVRTLSTTLNEETPLPYKFDVIALDLITNKDLLAHIHRFGKKLW